MTVSELSIAGRARTRPWSSASRAASAASGRRASPSRCAIRPPARGRRSATSARTAPVRRSTTRPRRSAATGRIEVRITGVERRPQLRPAERLRQRPGHRGHRPMMSTRSPSSRRAASSSATATTWPSPGIDLSSGPGEIYGLVGPNGAGKTTTMRILATLLAPTAGEAYVTGIPVTADPIEVRRRIGYMPDFYGVYDDLRVWEYLDFFGALLRRPGRAPRRRMIDELLEIVGLAEKRDALRRGPLARHAAAPVPGAHARPRPGAADPRRAGLRARSARAGRDARDPARAARDGQDDPGQQPHPPRARRAVHRRRRSSTTAGVLRSGSIDEIERSLRASALLRIDLLGDEDGRSRPRATGSEPIRASATSFAGTARRRRVTHRGLVRRDRRRAGRPAPRDGRRRPPGRRLQPGDQRPRGDLPEGDRPARPRRRRHDGGRRRQSAPRAARAPREFGSSVATIMVKELRSRMRGRRAFVVLTVYLGILALITYGVYVVVEPERAGHGRSAGSAASADRRTRRPSSASRSSRCCRSSSSSWSASSRRPSRPAQISLEREKQTLDLLISTPMRPGAIVIGKLAAALAFVVLMIVAAIPITAIVLMYGGASVEDIVRQQLVLLATAARAGRHRPLLLGAHQADAGGHRADLHHRPRPDARHDHALHLLERRRQPGRPGRLRRRAARSGRRSSSCTSTRRSPCSTWSANTEPGGFGGINQMLASCAARRQTSAAASECEGDVCRPVDQFGNPVDDAIETGSGYWWPRIAITFVVVAALLTLASTRLVVPAGMRWAFRRPRRAQSSAWPSRDPATRARRPSRSSRERA